MRSLHLLVPGLFWPDVNDPRPYADLSLPGIETLLSRGSHTVETVDGFEGWVARRFGFERGNAPLAAFGAGATPGDGDCWMNADPVHLSARGAELFLTAGDALAIGAVEADAFVARLNDFFAEDEIEFRALRPDRWVLRTRHPPADLHTTPLSAAHGRAIDALLPRGDDALAWLRLLNEAQMLLHGHEVNEARESAGRAAVNSLWFSNPGDCRPPPSRPFDTVIADEPFVAGLARAAGASVRESGAALQAGLAAATQGRVLVQTNGCWASAAATDGAGWLAALQAFDRDGVAPALLALRAGAIDALSITGFGGRSGLTVTLKRLDLLQFWKRHRRLSPPLAAGDGPRA